MSATGTNGGWKKYEGNPVLGGDLGTCFDISVLEVEDEIWMYFSWRPKASIALSKSKDGIHFSDPVIVLNPKPEREDGWEDIVNRISVVYKDGIYHMWYTGQYLTFLKKRPGQELSESHIFYATSKDGIHFERYSDMPVIMEEYEWELQNMMCPNVIWNDEINKYQMWYSAGEQNEPNAIGYAESEDGVHWIKFEGNPIFTKNTDHKWEQHKVAGCNVFRFDGWYYMFYIGYETEEYAQIGMARSKDGKTNWIRSSLNPIIAPDPEGFDASACYKPFVIFRDNKWMLWYNGRNGGFEQIALATNQNEKFDF